MGGRWSEPAERLRTAGKQNLARQSDQSGGRFQLDDRNIRVELLQSPADRKGRGPRAIISAFPANWGISGKSFVPGTRRRSAAAPPVDGCARNNPTSTGLKRKLTPER